MTTQKISPLLCYDIIFKSVFIQYENILAKMISDITEINYNLLKDNITLEANEIPIKRKNEKAKRCDFIAKINQNNIINLELNRQSHTGNIVKNLSYIFEQFATNTNKGKCYNENLKVIQINLNCFPEKHLKPLSKYHIRDDDDHSIYTNTIAIYRLNVVKCHELYYNNVKERQKNYIRWGALIYNNTLEKIPEIGKNIMTKEERNQIMDKLNDLKKDQYIMSELEALKWDDWERNTIYNDGIKEGIEQGIEQGMEQEKYNTIQTMLKKSYSIEDIKEITNCSIEYIQKIKENYNK